MIKPWRKPCATAEKMDNLKNTTTNPGSENLFSEVQKAYGQKEIQIILNAWQRLEK